MIWGNFRTTGLLTAICLLLLPTSGLFAQKTDAELFGEAESRFRSREYAFALDRYTTLTEEYPRSPLVPDAEFRRAVSMFRIGRQEDALDLFLKIQERYTSTRFISFVPFWVGVIQYNRGSFAEAAASLRQYLAAGEPSLLRQARLYLGICENELGNTDHAVEQLEMLLNTDFDLETEAYALTFLASLYVKQNRFEDVLELTRPEMISGLAGNEQLRMMLYRAEALWNTDSLPEAVAAYQDLVAAPPEISSIAYQRLFIYYQRNGNDRELQDIVLDAETELSGYGSILAEFWLRIGIESFIEGKYDLAKSYFQRIWNMKERIPISGLVPIYLAEIEAESGDTDEALMFLTTFLDYSDDRRELITYRIGATYLGAGNMESAAEMFTTFLAEFPESSTYAYAAYQNAYALYRLDEMRRAVALTEEVLSTARGGALTSSFLLLRSVLYRESGDYESSVTSLQEYLPLNPNDHRARLDLVKLHFRLGDFARVLSEADAAMENPPFDDITSSYGMLLRYMYGLAQISVQDYSAAIETLSGISLDIVRDADLLPIYPYVLYYRGWAFYRNGNYSAAEKDFAALMDGVPDHELQPRAAYLAGWSAYVLGQYRRAGAYLQKMSRSAPEELQTKSEFMYAKSLLQQDQIEEAAILFQNIYLDKKASTLSDDALFEYAGTLVVLDLLDESLDAYLKIWQEFPKSPLAEEGLYRRGELLFSAELYEDARDAFYQYRMEYSKGSLYDAALYWGGVAAFESGEAFRAVLLWEKLVESFPDSAFRADSLLRTAETYEDSGDFRKALNFYGELIAVYPEEADAISANLRTEKLRFLILGQGEQEAELSAIISQDGRNTQTGRIAVYELARIYIYKSGSKQNLAPDLLDSLISQSDVDPAYAAKAHYLYGEYYYRKNELQKAAQAFLQTVVTYPQDRDLSAQALYKAAEMAALSGSRSDAEALVGRIKTLFPSSSWVEEGEKLLEERGE